MLFTTIAHDYFRWHYGNAFKEMFHVWLNFLWFIINFFSLSQLMRSWIAPWKRMTEGRGDTFNLEDMAGFIIINLLSRVVGALIRSVIIFTGIFCLLIVVAMGFVTYLFWLIAPAAIISLLAGGITFFVGNIVQII